MAAAGWYPDPQGLAKWRAWDGTTWTSATADTQQRPAGLVGPVPLLADPPPVGGGPASSNVAAWFMFAAAIVVTSAVISLSAGVVVGVMCVVAVAAVVASLYVHRVRAGLIADHHPDPGVVEGALWWGAGKLTTATFDSRRMQRVAGVLVVHRGGLVWQPSQSATNQGAVRFRWSAKDLVVVEVPEKASAPLVLVTTDQGRHTVRLSAPAGCRAALADAGLPVAF